MRKTSLILLVSVALVTVTVVDVYAYLTEETVEEKTVREFLPKLEALENKYPHDTEIQLGLAFLYTKYGQSATVSAKERFQKVLTIDPNNRPVLAVLSRRNCRKYTATRNDFLDQLERKIDGAKKRQLKELTIPKYSPLYSFFDGDGVEAVVIGDFDAARQRLSEKLDKTFPLSSILSEISSTQSKDPKNAFYNYLKAHLYFDAGQKDKALKEIEEGVSKKYFSSYPEEVAKAVARVLREVDFPQPHRDRIASTRYPFIDFIVQAIWKRGLSDIGKGYEVQEDFNKAEKIYRLTIRMSKQVQTESIYQPSLGLELAAQRRIDELAKQMQSPIDGQMQSSGENSRSVQYVLIGSLCAAAVVAVVLLKKKSSSQGK